MEKRCAMNGNGWGTLQIDLRTVGTQRAYVIYREV